MGRMRGFVATSATTEAKVNSTAYTEQTSGAQRSIKSSSASDGVAGTGIRSVRITYFTLAAGVVAGPYTEDVVLNGTTFVATVATNIALIESIVALTAGSGGVAAGTITLYDDNAGAGSAITTIATGARQTYLGHAYVPTGQTCRLSDVILESTELTTLLTTFQLRSTDLSVANAAEQELGKAFVIKGSQGYQVVVPSPLLSANQLPIVRGPARLQWYVTPGANTAETALVDVGFTNS